jgi:hypothetical protein
MRFRFATARDLYAAYPTVAQEMRARPNDRPVLSFCRTLLVSRIPEEAITFCAYILPNRVAVWWGHECLQHLSAALDEFDLTMLKHVHGWVSDPSEYRRGILMDAALIAEQRSPGVWVALAAAWSQEDPQRPSGYPRSAQVNRTARAVSTGILAGLARVALADRAAALTGFVAMGIQLAEFEASRYS